MEKEKKQELLVGIVITIALLMLVLGIAWAKRGHFFSRRTQLIVRFETVKGLEPGDPVTIRGIDQGEVESIALDSGFVNVTLRLRGKPILFSDAEVFLADRDVMGRKEILIEPGKGPERLPSGAVLYGKVRLDILGLLPMAGELLHRMDLLLENLRTILEPNRLNRVLNNVEGSSTEIQAMVKENRTTIFKTLQQLEEITRTLKEDSSAFRLRNTLTRLDTTLEILKRLGKEDGTLYKLITDKELYDHLLRTSRNLDSLILDVKKNPQKYVRVSIF